MRGLINKRIQKKFKNFLRDLFPDKAAFIKLYYIIACLDIIYFIFAG
jgi:hypothetical protein